MCKNKKFVRMISKMTKWNVNKAKKLEEISADIITGCLRTQEDALSLWLIDDEHDFEHAIIAIGASRENVSPIDYIIIGEEVLKMHSLEYMQIQGKTPYTEYNGFHFDIVNLNYSKLGMTSKMILELINSGEEIKRVRAGDVKIKLLDAIKTAKIDCNDLKPHL